MTYLRDVNNLPKNIPIFPLTGALLLPKARLPLNIFEAKYLKMLEDVLGSQNRLIGMIQPLPVEEDEPHKTKLNKVGCAGRIVSFTETEDSRYLITLAGICRFNFIEILGEADPYFKGKVDWSPFLGDRKEEKMNAGLKRDVFLDILSKYFKLTNLQTDWESLRQAEDELLINSLSMMCPFDQHEKQALLEAKTIKERAGILQTLMEMTLKAEKSFGPLQ